MSAERRAPVKRYRVVIAGDGVDVGIQEDGGALRVSVGGATRRAELAEVVPGRFALVLDGRVHDLTVLDAESGPGAAFPRPALRVSLVIDGEPYLAEVGRQSPGGAGQRTAAPHPGEMRAPMPGLLVAVRVLPGEAVALGQPLIIMEAMKMQMEIRAPRAGTVRAVHVAPGQEITGGQPLVTLD